MFICRLLTFICPQQKYQIPFEKFRRLCRRLTSQRPAQYCPARTPCRKKSGKTRPSKSRQIRLCRKTKVRIHGDLEVVKG